MISQETRNELRKPFPPEAITQHPTKTFLSTIKAIYITERLNDIFGIGGWIIHSEIISDTTEYVAMKGQLEILGENGFKTSWQYGGHGKIGKNTEPADGYKSAVTDCLSKCASYLEIGIDVFKGRAKPQKGNTQAEGRKPNTQPPDKPTPKNPDAPITPKQKELLNNKMKFKKLSADDRKDFFQSVLGLASSKDPTVSWASDFIENFDDYLGVWKAAKDIKSAHESA